MMTRTINNPDSSETAILFSHKELPNGIHCVVKRDKEILIRAENVSLSSITKMIDAKLFSYLCLN